jgi:ethanolamine ammonia-lyase large subunit
MREVFGRRPAPEFEDWLGRMGLTDGAGRIRPSALPVSLRALLPASLA